MSKVIKIELTIQQETKYDEWVNHLTAIFGDEGMLTWSITFTGIGNVIKVTSDHAPKYPLDLTEVRNW